MNEPTWTVGLGKGVYHSTSVYNVQIKNGIHLNFRVDRVGKEKWDFWNYYLVIAVLSVCLVYPRIVLLWKTKKQTNQKGITYQKKGEHKRNKNESKKHTSLLHNIIQLINML